MRHSIRSQIFTGNYRDLLIVGTEGDEGQSADEVLRIHDAKLAKMGTDNLTRGAIDSYRKRHFGTADPLIPGQVKTPPAPPAPQPVKAPVKQEPKITKDPLPQRAPTAAEQAAAAVRLVVKPQPTAPPAAVQTTDAPAPDPVDKPTDIAQASAPAVAPSAPADGGICEKCGAPVTKSQEKLSKLFLNKTLCKSCMEAP